MILESYINAHDPVLAEKLAAVGSVNQLIDELAINRADKQAIDMPAIDDGRMQLTYGELLEKTCRIAAGLQRLGLKNGDRVAILAEGAAYGECVLSYLALLRLGCVMVPINPRYVDEEIEHALKLTECIGIFASKLFAKRIEGIGSQLIFRIAIGQGAQGVWIPWNSLPCDKPVGGFSGVSQNSPANIIFTSGTTGRPKGVVHTHGTALACGAIYSTALTLVAGDVYHHPIPFCTSSGTQFTIMATLWAGATHVTEPEFNAGRVIERMKSKKTTIFLGVPSHLLFLIDEMLRCNAVDFPDLRIWNYGGSVMPKEAISTLKNHFPGVELRQNYGMTETGPTGTLLGPNDVLKRLGSTGQPMPLCEIQIIDITGAVVPVAQVGEICVRSPACMKTYYGNPSATQETLVDGWIKTGDVGYLDDDGFLFYTDRSKDIINRGGLKVGSVEIEEVLYRSKDVLEAAVIAIPHPRLGEDIAAFIVQRPGGVICRKELDDLMKRSLASYKIPRYITVVSSLPKNAMGKVLKAELRQLITDGGEVAELGNAS